MYLARNGSAGTATSYGLDGPRIESLVFPTFPAPVQTGSEGPSPSCTTNTDYFPGVKRPGRGADHPHPSSAEIANSLEPVAYPGIFSGGVQQIQLRTENRDLGAVAPSQGFWKQL